MTRRAQPAIWVRRTDLRSSAPAGALSRARASHNSPTPISSRSHNAEVGLGQLDSPGILTIVGDYTQTSGGVLVVEIGGLNPGTDFDQLNITGQATLDGTLTVNLINGFFVYYVPGVIMMWRLPVATGLSASIPTSMPPTLTALGLTRRRGTTISASLTAMRD
jgi:hypothetical protein